MSLIIRPAKIADWQQWHILWQQYLAFYQVDNFNPKLTATLWQRIHCPVNPIGCFVAQHASAKGICAIVHYLHHCNTWYAEPVGYLEDLYVSPSVRGAGIGSALIDAVVEHGKSQGWANIYWQTKHDNRAARQLYDKITGGTDGFVTYRIQTVG